MCLAVALARPLVRQPGATEELVGQPADPLRVVQGISIIRMHRGERVSVQHGTAALHPRVARVH